MRSLVENVAYGAVRMTWLQTLPKIGTMYWEEYKMDYWFIFKHGFLYCEYGLHPGYGHEEFYHPFPYELGDKLDEYEQYLQTDEFWNKFTSSEPRILSFDWVLFDQAVKLAHKKNSCVRLTNADWYRNEILSEYKSLVDVGPTTTS